MAWTQPEPCGWYQITNPCSDTNEFKRYVNYPLTVGPHNRGHNISTDYNITVGNTTIPIVRTTRNWQVNYTSTHTPPTSGGGVAVYNATTGYFDLYDCTEVVSPPATYQLIITDNCVIEKSILYYLDQRYGVCLYKYQKDELYLSVNSSEYAAFKTDQGNIVCNQAQIKTSNYTAQSTVEWRLLIDGIENILTQETSTLEPFGPKNNGVADTTGFAAGWIPDPETRLILVFPQPPSKAIPLTPEIVRLGFYDYGNLPGGESDLNISDGGYKDMFYPLWCRNLQEDPFWRAAADRRYAISWFHVELDSNSTYTPPDIAVNPLPIGSFVRHPVVGDVYQFLIENTPISSNNFSEILTIINNQLPDDMKTHDTTLIYPISLV